MFASNHLHHLLCMLTSPHHPKHLLPHFHLYTYTSLHLQHLFLYLLLNTINHHHHHHNQLLNTTHLQCHILFRIRLKMF
jgi:hypothetical protein